MAKIYIFLLACVLGSVAAIGILPRDHSPEKRWADYFMKKPSLKSIDKLRLIREKSPFSPPTKDFQADVCYTPECLDASIALLESINFTANPCEDFFEFSCGKWLAENPIPPSSSRWSHFDVLIQEVNDVTQGILTTPEAPEDFRPVKQVKDFYKQCTDLAAIESEGLALVIGILTIDGGWPAITANWNPAGFDLINVIAQARREFLDSIFTTVYVSQDLRNTTRSVVYLDQPEFFLSRAVLLNQDQFQARINAYKTYFVSVAQELAKITGTQVVESELVQQVEDVIAFETRLAEISAADENRTIIDRIYNPYKLDAYQAEIDAVNTTNPYAKIQYTELLELIFSTSGIRIEAQEDIIVLEKDYLKNLITVLDQTDIRTIANYVHWRLVSGLVPETTQVFRDIKFEFDKVNSGLQQPRPRDNTCASTSLNVFGMAIGVKYIEEAFDPESKNNVDLMVENLRAAFKELLDEADWMDEETKANADKKVTSMRQFMAYPDWLFNQTRLEEEFAGLNIVSGKFLQSVLAASHWMGDQQLKTLRDITDKDYWLTYPGVVNAFYAPEFNSITFPAGILQPPFYRSRGPESINYGGIGVVIGHEITHGFDDQGSQFDDEGNAKNWWSEEVLARFLEKAQCIIDQYSGFSTEVGNVNGDLTSGENIADNGGVRQSYLAYQNWVRNNNGGQEEARLPGLEEITPDQLFFLGYGNIWCESITLEALQNQLLGDPHSPARFRVLGALQNSATFAEKWGCPVGSPMNPSDKCVLW